MMKLILNALRMWRPRPRWAVLLGAALLVSALGTGVSLAATYPVQTSPLQVHSGNLVPGGAVTVAGGGFQPGATVSIDVHSTVVHLADATADATGFISTTVTIPSSLPSGKHELTATGAAPGGGTQTLGVSFPVGGGTLPFTGMPTMLVGGSALVAVLAGGTLLLASRRRRAHS